MNRYVIDRFEGDWAVIEPFDGGETLDIPRSWLNFPAREGDVVALSEGLAEYDHEATRERAEVIRRKMDMLWEKE